MLPDITKLTDRELKELNARLDLLLSTKSVKYDLTLWDELFYRVIESILETELHQKIPSLVLLKKKKTKHIYKLVKDTREYIDTWAKSVIKRRITRPEIIKIYKMYVDLVVQYLIDCKVPISLRTILLQHDKFPGIFDRAFPGYIVTNNFLLILNSKYQDVRLTED